MNWGSTWDFLWHFLIIFAWIAYLLVLFQILTDLFWRDHKTSGWVKALWVIFLIHWHAFLLWLKRLPVHAKAARPDLQRDIFRPHSSVTTKPTHE